MDFQNRNWKTGDIISATEMNRMDSGILELLNLVKTDCATKEDLTQKMSEIGVITAAKLLQNGYVEYSNGFVLQWGNVAFQENEKIVQVTLPLPCSTRLIVCPSDLSNGSVTPIGLCSEINGSTVFDGKTIAFCRDNNQTRVDWFMWFGLFKK